MKVRLMLEVCAIVDNEGWGGDAWLAGEIRSKK
jgi:hypothetical protein